MKAQEFREWRQRWGLTQSDVAEKFFVTRTTIQNWESGSSPITKAVDMSCAIWEERLKQEDADRGPVTLVYSDAPMFINPQGPRRAPAMMRQEPYLTNAAALARVANLWGRSDFHNPFIIEEKGRPLWNAVELARVVGGKDDGAPTIANLVRRIASEIMSTSDKFVSTGPSRGSVAQKDAIEKAADELAQIASSPAKNLISAKVQLEIEAKLEKLRKLGKHPSDKLVSNLAQAFVACELGHQH